MYVSPDQVATVSVSLQMTAGNMARCSPQDHPKLVAGVAELAQRVQADKQLAALVRRKFAIKCTTGYSLNALVDFPTSDPVEIIKRLLIGSEGTLGFVSRATYNTVPEWPHKVRRVSSGAQAAQPRPLKPPVPALQTVQTRRSSSACSSAARARWALSARPPTTPSPSGRTRCSHSAGMQTRSGGPVQGSFDSIELGCTCAPAVCGSKRVRPVSQVANYMRLLLLGGTVT